MGALRKAGVWLGLIEDDDERYETDDDSRYSERRPNSRDRDHERHDYEYEDAEPAEEPEIDAPRLRAAAAAAETRAERASLRSLGGQGGRGTVTTLTQDNLALAPQVQLRERAVVAEDDESGYRIMTLHPTTYNEARTIGERFRDGTPVIMNLTEMDEADAKRLVDFAAGLAFGLRGTIERVTNRVFLLSPANVTVTAEDKAKIAEGGFFHQS
ncbi:cell division protein SepF [Longispora albida]|uniref:cell division protein SepF n=1 Tax=Longispora albida TaxID=203523 RepID=UPI0003786DA3|nr:cell division protein SepF [Longispora albida]